MLFLIFRIRFFILRLLFIINDYRIFLELNLFTVNSSSIVITFLFDWISLLFIRFVLFISSIVVYYRKEYMIGDLNINRFIILVAIFVLSIILLIISPNLIRILLGWDGLGLVSYCLVIYYQNIKSYNAGILTALTNRIGDVALLLSIAWIINYGRWNFIFYIRCIKNDFIIEIIAYLIILAAITKRAQIPFSSWLPAAIAAPTPVSSLVHSSTLVTAGIYLLIRFRILFNNFLINLILFIGCITIFISGLGANFEFDLKKIIALSTLRQLGLIIRILALGEYSLAFFHLLTHALFKATLFICAGNLIHNLNNCQDIRYIGNLIYFIPLSCSFFSISNLALCGIPFLSGFYSKDLILEIVSINYLNIFIYLIFFISTGLTVSYTFRLIYYLLIGDYNFLSLSRINDSRIYILKGIGGLIFFVIIGGRILVWIIYPSPFFICLPIIIKLIALIVTLIGGFIGFYISNFIISYNSISLFFYKIRWFLGRIWNIPILSTLGINFYPIYIGNLITINLDQGWSELFGRQNIYLNLKKNSLFFQYLFSNNLKIFFILLVVWIILLIILLYLNSLI